MFAKHKYIAIEMKCAIEKYLLLLVVQFRHQASGFHLYRGLYGMLGWYSAHHAEKSATKFD